MIIDLLLITNIVIILIDLIKLNIFFSHFLKIKDKKIQIEKLNRFLILDKGLLCSLVIKKNINKCFKK